MSRVAGLPLMLVMMHANMTLKVVFMLPVACCCVSTRMAVHESKGSQQPPCHSTKTKKFITIGITADLVERGLCIHKRRLFIPSTAAGQRNPSQKWPNSQCAQEC